jgi:hypothetical protein
MMSSVDVTLPIDHILNANPAWLREDLGDLGPLSKSLKKEGQYYPVLLDSTYRVIDGARRIEAARLIGWTTIYVVVARDFFTMSSHLKNTRDGQFELPHDVFALMELLHIMREIYRPHARAMSAKSRGQRYPKQLTEGFSGSAIDIPEAMGMSANQVEELGRVRRTYTNPAHTPEMRKRLREAMYPVRFNIFSSLNAMQMILQHRPTVTSKKVISDQRSLIPRAMSGLQGAALALPNPADLDPGHDLEEVAVWLKQLNKIHGEIFALRKKFKEMLKDQGDQS